MSQQTKIKSPTGEVTLIVSWQCPRCRFVLHKLLLYTKNMAVAINQDAEAELCPNDGVILVPLRAEGH